MLTFRKSKKKNQEKIDVDALRVFKDFEKF